MKRQIGHTSRSFAPALRALLTVLLTVAYVVVGIGGEIACAEETLMSVEQLEFGHAPGELDQNSKKPAEIVVDHCYTCVPLLLPPPILVGEPAAKSVPPTYTTPAFRLEDHPALDTPPPKYRT